MIEVKNISKKFGKLDVLNDVSFNISQGGIYAVLGPNGSGKTTILKIILGMVLPQNGKVIFQGKNASYRWEYRKDIGYLPQIARFPDNLSVQELISMIRDMRDEKADARELIELFGVEKFLDKKLGNLSGGTRQKVNIVLTFMFDAPVLILDEPTAGLDPVSLIKLKDLIRQERGRGKIIIITTHIMNLVEELADEIIFLLEGNIYFQGTVNELQANTQTSDLEHSIASILSHA